jgi:hypothetical protein
MQKIIELKTEETRAVIGGLARAHPPNLFTEVRVWFEHLLRGPVMAEK